MIRELETSSGNFRDILGLPRNGPVELSSSEWANCPAVIQNVEFDNATIRNSKCLVDFVDCNFKCCTFENFATDGHFSGGRNTWEDCQFKKCQISDLIAPQSRFKRCTFDEVHIDGFRMCETSFIACSFQLGVIRGLFTRRIGDRSRQLPETVAKGATALFQDCNFSQTRFSGCKFSYVCFSECQIEDTSFEHCSFEDVISRDDWVRQLQPGDPFLAFLEAAISAISKKLGSGCDSVRVLEEYMQAYQLKRKTSKEYSEVLFDGRISDRELDLIDDVLDRVEASFPFG